MAGEDEGRLIGNLQNVVFFLTSNPVPRCQLAYGGNSDCVWADMGLYHAGSTVSVLALWNTYLQPALLEQRMGATCPAV